MRAREVGVEGARNAADLIEQYETNPNANLFKRYEVDVDLPHYMRPRLLRANAYGVRQLDVDVEDAVVVGVMRRRALLAFWRRIGAVAGRLACAQLRAAERVYAPGCAGFREACDDFDARRAVPSE